MTLFMPKSFTIQFFFNFSNFIGMKMHGREARVSISKLGAKTPGRPVMMGFAWRERRLPSGISLGRNHLCCLQPVLQVFHLLFSLCSLSFSSLVHAVTFHYSVQPSKHMFSLRFFSVVFITKWTSEFPIGFSSSNCISLSLSLSL